MLDAGAQQALGHLAGAAPAGMTGVQVDVLAGVGEPLDAVLEQDGAPGVEAVGGDGVGFDHDGGSCRAQVVDEPVDPATVVPAGGGALAGGAAAAVGEVVGDQHEQGPLPAGLGGKCRESGQVLGAVQPARLGPGGDRVQPAGAVGALPAGAGRLVVHEQPGTAERMLQRRVGDRRRVGMQGRVRCVGAGPGQRRHDGDGQRTTEEPAHCFATRRPHGYVGRQYRLTR